MKLSKHFLVVCAHLIGNFIIFKTINFISPNGINWFIGLLFNIALCLWLSMVTFQFTKKIFLSDRVNSSRRAIFITGCDSGFGHHLAKRLDSKGFCVFAGCLFPSGDGASDLKLCCSEKLRIVELDVTREESIKKALEIIKNNLVDSKLWAIVNNAGILKGSSVELTSIKSFQDCMEVNAFGPLRVSKAFLPLLRESKGRVVNVTSIAGKFPLPHVAAYIMSKFAAQALNECLRQELSSFGIPVISIEPDAFKTALTSADRISDHLDGLWKTVEDDIKSDYGEEHLKLLKNFNKMLNSTTSPNINKVIDDLETAICSKYPNVTYKPSTNVVIRAALTLITLAPTCIQDLNYKMFELAASYV